MDVGLQTDRREPWLVVAVSGDVDLATAPRLREQLRRFSAEGHDRLVIDLDAVGVLDSTGLGVLIGALRRARSTGGEVGLVCTTERLLQLLELCRLDRAFPVWTSVEEAVER